VIQGYGLTETTSVLTSNSLFRTKTASVGKACKNIKLKLDDVTKGIKEKNLDLITLDLLTPTKIPNIAKALKQGSYAVAYVPHLEQAEQFISYAEKQGLWHEKTIEVIERQWNWKNSKLKEEMGAIGHTGYLVFMRKI